MSDSQKDPQNDPMIIAGRKFNSRLIIGTGKFKDYAENAAALEASGADMVTVAIRRVNLDQPDAPLLTDFIKPDATTYLPNTAGCYTGDDAVRTLRLARELGGWNLVKLEVRDHAIGRADWLRAWLAEPNEYSLSPRSGLSAVDCGCRSRYGVRSRRRYGDVRLTWPDALSESNMRWPVRRLQV